MTCSDGVVQSECNEGCDDGNLVTGDGCNSSCKLEAATATPTPMGPTPTLTPTPIVPGPTPSGGIVPLGTLARRCQVVLADQARAFAEIAHRQLQGCLDDILAGISDGKSSRLLKSCRKALDSSDPASVLVRARAKILARVATRCRGLGPSEINSTPCSQTASSVAEVALCLLDQHAASVESMVAAEYGDVCGLLTFYDLGVGLPALCVAP
jgi:cysteine-rich repeat protein